MLDSVDAFPQRHRLLLRRPRFAASARGKDLQEAREAAGLTRLDAAMPLGVTAGALKRMEGQAWVRPETFRSYTQGMRGVLISRRAAFEASVMLTQERARGPSEAPHEPASHPESAHVS